MRHHAKAQRGNRSRRAPHRRAPKGLPDDHTVTHRNVTTRQPITLRCALCSMVEISDPGVTSNWRVLTVDGAAYYVCPKHFPDDILGSVSEFAAAYRNVIAALRGAPRPRD